jgi:hypothetical protein
MLTVIQLDKAVRHGDGSLTVTSDGIDGDDFTTACFINGYSKTIIRLPWAGCLECGKDYVR